MLVLQVGFEQHRRVLAPQHVLPGVGVLYWHQVYFVQQEDNLFLAGHPEYFLFYGLAPAGQGIPRIQNLHDNIAGLDDFLDLLKVLFALPDVNLNGVILLLGLLNGLQLCVLIHKVVQMVLLMLFELSDRISQCCRRRLLVFELIEHSLFVAVEIWQSLLFGVDCVTTSGTFLLQTSGSL